ncbi:hypothetical protein BDZ45DRAFT_143265 [Acephala macrosclerotiorum]|nr:hypothetical protein BDZ45DRAFT_143265 [Acephala macrosclerotiorum]
MAIYTLQLTFDLNIKKFPSRSQLRHSTTTGGTFQRRSSARAIADSIPSDESRVHTKPNSKMARITHPQLKAICRQRRLSTKGTKRDLRATIKKDDQKRQHQEAKCRPELKQLEKEFGGSGIDVNEAGEGRPLGSVSNVPAHRGRLKRGLRRLCAIERASLRATNAKGMKRSQNRYQELHRLGTEADEENETSRHGRVTMDTSTELANTSPALEQNITTNIALQPDVPNYDGEIDELALRISNLESPFLYLDGAGQAMSTDFRDEVRDWGVEFSDEEEL